MSDLYRYYKHDEAPTVADVPEGWTRTSRKAEIVDGIEWRSYRSGLSSFTSVAERPGLVTVHRNYNRSTYSAYDTGKVIGRLFRSETTAMEAVAKRKECAEERMA